MQLEKTLDELIESVIQAMHDAKYATGSISNFERMFKRLQKLAKSRKEAYYSTELGQIFIEDSSYANSQEFCNSRYCYHSRCIHIIESYLRDGEVDWSVQKKLPQQQLKSDELITAIDSFEKLMSSNGLKENTKDGYRRLVQYYMQFLESRGYRTLSQIKSGDTVMFIAYICTEHYQPASLGSHLPGLRLFLKMSETTERFEIELPAKLPKKREILEIYTDEEYAQIYEYLGNSDISLRDKSICLIALETGLRAVDICKLRLQDIDWRNDCIHIIQEKTQRAMNIPISASFGNALADYLLLERPVSDSEYVYLRSTAPFATLSSHSGYRHVLFKAVTASGVDANGRSFGTRITRHSTASKMLRQGVPLPVISEALGHSNPNSVMIYITTESAKLAECTLPLPEMGRCL